MRILHTADLHIGQILYQYYDRSDEHRHFFSQLIGFIKEYIPDVLIVAGDIFDVSQPSASCWKLFTETFVNIRKTLPDIAIVIIAGNHDSASRLQSHSQIWALADTYVVGTPPPLNWIDETEWEEKYILRLESGYVIMLPYGSIDRCDAAIRLQEYVARENKEGKPVVMTGHLAVTGADCTGHDPEIGMLKTIPSQRLGKDFDYMALGHIHRPQTICPCKDTYINENAVYEPPVIRYSGSALHVSCDETYPHSVSLIDVSKHGGPVSVKPLQISELRHFVTLPHSDQEFLNEKSIFKELKAFISRTEYSCYIRFRINRKVDLSSDFNNKVYRLLEESGKDLRYNPKINWSESKEDSEAMAVNTMENLGIEDLQQMDNPMEFVIRSADRYPDLDLDKLRDAFSEIENELMHMSEERATKSSKGI